MTAEAIVTPPAPTRSWPERARAAVSAVSGAVSGVAPHVLHHVGPLAGAALVSGALGTAVFGAIGLVATAPLLWRLRRRTGGWLVPTAALAAFAVMFTISTYVVGPAISGDPVPATSVPAVDHDAHH